MRRRPAQRRSLERVERMLDECAHLLDEVGYDALTTKEVARRAEVPIGTFYQFFSDKQALVRALALRNLEAFLERVIGRLPDNGPPNWTGIIDLAVDEFVAMKQSRPGFAVVDFGEVLPSPGGPALKGTHHMLDAVMENNAVVAERLRRLAVETFNAPAGPDLERALLVAVEAADAVLKLAFRLNPQGAPELIAECKLLLRRYLAGHLA
ncbi:DNA-binding transcriptional regulator, AcrR family [Sinosporangium album]|uniref:DNA-binding transcriptional regulator, AcrR family n=1 Tax=Sinosporangium album TaxID=504805 RepID=A0A1G8B2Y5_9ACTN|nr:DNA-binding transcriptional regulator, AcrR family [Sinosporangium album]